MHNETDIFYVQLLHCKLLDIHTTCMSSKKTGGEFFIVVDNLIKIKSFNPLSYIATKDLI